MLYLLFILTIVYVAVNLYLDQNDYLSPSVIFGAVFLIANLLCVLEAGEFAITFHSETVVLFALTYIAMTAAHIFSNREGSIFPPRVEKGSVIEVSRIFYVILILLQLVSLYSFYGYLKTMSMAYYGYVADLSSMIKLYNNMTNFWIEYAKTFHFVIPMVYRLLGPVTTACAYLVLYIAVQNFVLTQKIDWLAMLVLLLEVADIVLNSSRSPIFRMVTMAMVLFYVFSIRYGKLTQGDLRLLRKIFIIVFVCAVLFLAGMVVIGRSIDTRISHYVFIYSGAPLLNLDTRLHAGKFLHSKIFGANTFGSLYRYIAKIFHVGALDISVDAVAEFMKSKNGLSTGNVFTLLYPLVSDFGFAGTFVFVFLEGAYYCCTYRRVLRSERRTHVIDYRLFIYGYLMNDLIMCFFSSRFYETVFAAPFLKLFVLTWMIDRFFIEKQYKVDLVYE